MSLTIYQAKDTTPEDAAKRLKDLPDPPAWRRFDGRPSGGYQPDSSLVRMVNAALILRRPLVVTGDPGSGKTSIATHVAEQLNLPGPFRWSITSRTTLQDGLYQYDALGRLNDIQIRREQQAPTGGGTGHAKGNQAEKQKENIGQYIRLGPVGMAFAVTRLKRPAVLLIDEFDKSDLDLPNDLLHLFEERSFEIPELQRLGDEEPVVPVLPCLSKREGCDYGPKGKLSKDPQEVERGRVVCREDFPLVIITSNGEREFPPPLWRRCLSAKAESPNQADQFEALVKRHFPMIDAKDFAQGTPLRIEIERFAEINRQSIHSPDQLFNLVTLLREGVKLSELGEPFLKSVAPPMGARTTSKEKGP